MQFECCQGTLCGEGFGIVKKVFCLLQRDAILIGLRAERCKVRDQKFFLILQNGRNFGSVLIGIGQPSGLFPRQRAQRQPGPDA